MSKTLFTIKTLTHQEKRDKQRKRPVPPSRAMRDERNDYKRKGKFGNDWE